MLTVQNTRKRLGLHTFSAQVEMMTQVSHHGQCSEWQIWGKPIILDAVSIGEDEDGEIAVAVQWGWSEEAFFVIWGSKLCLLSRMMPSFSGPSQLLMQVGHWGVLSFISGVKDEVLHVSHIEEEVTVCAPLGDVGGRLWVYLTWFVMEDRLRQGPRTQSCLGSVTEKLCNQEKMKYGDDGVYWSSHAAEWR